MRPTYVGLGRNSLYCAHCRAHIFFECSPRFSVSVVNFPELVVTCRGGVYPRRNHDVIPIRADSCDWPLDEIWIRSNECDNDNLAGPYCGALRGYFRRGCGAIFLPVADG